MYEFHDEYIFGDNYVRHIYDIFRDAYMYDIFRDICKQTNTHPSFSIYRSICPLNTIDVDSFTDILHRMLFKS